MYRRIRTSTARSRPEAIAVAVFEKTAQVPSGYKALDDQGGGELGRALKRQEFSSARDAVTALYPSSGPGRLYVIGLGQRDKGVAQGLRQGTAALLRTLDKARVSRVRLHLGPGLQGALGNPDAGRWAGEAFGIANFQFLDFKGAASDAPDNTARDLSVQIDGPMRSGFARGLEIGKSVNIARTLAAMPPNIANPAYLVRYCRRMATRSGLRCSVITAAKAAKLHMGGLLAVGRGGSSPPAVICLEHPGPPGRSRKKQKPVVLVGKAVTFDTGGYSLKPAQSMASMKYDKCGGMAVIGALHAVAALKLPVRVVGIVPVVENLVGQKSYRPDDIITMHNGVTVEVTNTDAEGRLILADALSHACRAYDPSALIDLATLTGGVVTALGSFCAGAFCAQEKLRQGLEDAGEYSGERLWTLPLWEEHREMLKSEHGDLVNSAGRGAHPIQGAAFLSHFTGTRGGPEGWDQRPWAHLDIAGVATTDKDTALFPKGPTGFGVRLLVRLLETWGA